MNCLVHESRDPFFNLAVDEYLLRKREGDFVVLGINDKSVIIGKHQVAHREANAGFLHLNNIPVIRRISGGGTVYHDRGNLNFTFIRQSEPGRQIDFRKYTEPVLGFLSTLGVRARFEGKNDLRIDGLKISGNAEHVYGNRVLHHGTLLFDASLEDLSGALDTNRSRYTTRAVDSNPSQVTNLKEHTREIEDCSGLMSAMMDYFLRSTSGAVPCRLTPAEIDEIESLAETKYRTWEWNYAYGPDYQFMNCFSLGGKQLSCRLSVKEGIIRECLIQGSEVVSEAGNLLKGVRHMVQDVREAFQKSNILLDYNDVYRFF